MYNKSIVMLNKVYPESFPLEEFTYEAFKFSWNSVQARAFGRRLPWTAMVPFADCLNHSNVQTKYDYDVEGNGVFRLFPSGSNHYPAGQEVFNSYGRRPNENLLMDYGFAMLNNEWDDVSGWCGVDNSISYILHDVVVFMNLSASQIYITYHYLYLYSYNHIFYTTHSD